MAESRVFHLLLVDDDPLIHQSLKLCLPKEWRVFSVQNPADVPFSRFFHAAFVDMHLFGDIRNPAGLEVVKKLSISQPQLEVVAISGDLSLQLMEQGLKVGAQKFLAKPFVMDEVLLILDKIAALWNLRTTESPHKQSKQWIGQSEVSQNIRKQVADLRGESKPVLIEGETGSGKEVIAQLLHHQEPPRPMISINMASLPEHLFESEMFGHVKGAFTGADSHKIGLIEAAHGGDLFLDEIEALSLSHQAKLLRFLENAEIRRVGAKENIQVQTRVLAASNKSLEQMVKNGEFREDLYFRISAQKIKIPPLRDRKEDIKELAVFFLESEKPRRNKKMMDDAVTALQNYSWPGNVRELKRICEQLSLTSPLPLIRSEDVQGLLNRDQQWHRESLDFPLNFQEGLSKLVEKFEAMVIRQTLAVSKDIEAAAETLKISRSSLYKKIKDYNIEEDSL